MRRASRIDLQVPVFRGNSVLPLSIELTTSLVTLQMSHTAECAAALRAIERPRDIPHRYIVDGGFSLSAWTWQVRHGYDQRSARYI
jgi:hypothetical protein